MQIIVNCLIRLGSQVVMLQKPRRGWWVLPGGKVEENELWTDGAIREALEESGLAIEGLTLRGIHMLRYTGVVDDTQPFSRCIVQFVAHKATGELLSHSKEGVLALHNPEDIQGLPMDPGDKLMVEHTLSVKDENDPRVFFGKFTYTPEHVLLDWTMTSTGTGSQA